MATMTKPKSSQDPKLKLSAIKRMCTIAQREARELAASPDMHAPARARAADKRKAEALDRITEMLA